LLTPEQCELFMAAGAGAIVAKHHPVADLVDVLVAVSRGDVVVQALFRRPRRPAWPGSGLGLTERQSEVASLLAADLSLAAISSALLIQVGTVREYVRTVLGKLGVDSVGGAVRRLSDDAQFRRSSIASRWRAVGV
jgi:DNA-binding NarL/FixJ family response regulator